MVKGLRKKIKQNHNYIQGKFSTLYTSLEHWFSDRRELVERFRIAFFSPSDKLNLSSLSLYWGEIRKYKYNIVKAHMIRTNLILFLTTFLGFFYFQINFFYLGFLKLSSSFIL